MDISLVFFGSGPVAAASLELLAHNFSIEAVITKPKPPHHKGDFPVINWCSRPDAPVGEVLTVSSKAELSVVFKTHHFSSQLGVVIDFGIIIAQDVIDAFPLGIINSHFSLLPQWRGADPITFSILSGQSQTGVSLMRITAGLDEGPLLATGIYSFDGTETTPVLTEKLIRLSNELLTQELPRYVNSPHMVMTQEQVATAQGRLTEPNFSRKLTKDDGLLDWTKPAAQLEREIRAFAGWPQSRTKLGVTDVIITVAHVGDETLSTLGEHTADSSLTETTTPASAQPGSIWRAGKQFGVYASDGILVIDKLKPAGKKDMTAEAFLNGYGASIRS